MGCAGRKPEDGDSYTASLGDVETQWQEIFRLFDKKGKGYISNNKLGHVMRGLDLDPSERSVQLAVQQMDQDLRGVITYETFQKFMLNLRRPSLEERRKQLQAAFRQIDPDNEKYVSVERLQQVLTSLGEPLTESEVTAVIRGTGVNRMGVVYYKDLVDFILDPAEISPRNMRKSKVDELGQIVSRKLQRCTSNE